MNGLRILHLGKFYPPARGGMETVLQTLCDGERKLVDTRALVMNGRGRTAHDVVNGVPVTRVRTVMKAGAVSVAPSLPLWLRRTDADLLVLHEPNPMVLLAYFLARPAQQLIVWYHSEVIRPGWKYRLFYQPFLEFALRRVARIVVASPPMTEVPALAKYRSKCVVIPYGLEVDRYRPGAVRARVQALRERAARPTLLFIGRLVPYKGVEVLLRALPGLDARTVIVGDGPLRRDLEGLAGSLGIADRVHFVGNVSDDDRVAWLHACDALVLPSVTRQEAFGIVQLEAMLCRRPVVSTDLPTGVPWVNIDGETGLVARAGEVASLRMALDRLMGDADLRRRLGAAARARVLQLFTADRMCASALTLYHEVTGRALPAAELRDAG